MTLVLAILTTLAGGVEARACLKAGAAPAELEAQAGELLRARQITFGKRPGGGLQIVADAGGSRLNRWAETVRAKYGARVVVSPADLVCGASADTDPADVCDLTVALGDSAITGDETGSTTLHEAKHLEQAAPQTNGGFDSLFFGRISNLDGTDHSSYPSFALDEIPAYAAELENLRAGQKVSLESYDRVFRTAATQLRPLVRRAKIVVDRYLAFLNRLERAKGFSVIKSDIGGLGVVDLRRSDEPAIFLQRIDWRNAGLVNTVTLVDAKDQLTLPLFGSKFDVEKSMRLVGKGSKWPVAPVAAELGVLKKRLRQLADVLARAERGLDAPGDHGQAFRAIHEGERVGNLGLTKLACRSGAAPALAPAPVGAVK